MLTTCDQTISCLLIHPNPDSALNATAGHLLQDDYDSFFRQARLMTSIHASIPSDLKEAVLAAKKRGEEPGNTILEHAEQRPTMKGKSASSSSVIMKKLSQRITSTQSAPQSLQLAQEDENSGSENDEKSGSKENDPMLSPAPVPAQMPRRPMLAKRPLSDLPIPSEIDNESIEAPCISPSEQNVVNNMASTPAHATVENTRKAPQLAERSQSVNLTGRGLQDTDANGSTAVCFEERAIDDTLRPAKRVCSEESKENVAEGPSLGKLPERPLPVVSRSSKAGMSAQRKASAPGSLGAGSLKGKSRVGLRRL